MQIIEYYTSKEPEHWLNELEKCDWGAGKFLLQLLREGKLKETVGQTALVLMLVDNQELISFCTYAPLDDIRPTELSPWIGFVYTFPAHRGHRYAGELFAYAEGLATIMGKEAMYISTNHIGLYEKYGYEFYRMGKDIGGEDSRIYRKILNLEGPQRDARMEDGGKHKSAIVEAAREEIQPVAYCGFSCNHCFLGQWCGGCRSVFNCCSYGTMHEKGKCPHQSCCEEMQLEGCYACKELEHCEKGFYAQGNPGATACKAQAMFIQKYGKERFLAVHDKLQEKYEHKELQEILDKDINTAIQMLEEQMNKV